MPLLSIHNVEITADLPSEIMLLSASPVMGRDGRSFTYTESVVLEGFMKHGQKLPIDVDHKSECGFSTITCGGIEDIYFRNNQLWARVDWNEEGKRLVSLL